MTPGVGAIRRESHMGGRLRVSIDFGTISGFHLGSLLLPELEIRFFRVSVYTFFPQTGFAVGFLTVLDWRDLDSSRSSVRAWGSRSLLFK